MPAFVVCPSCEGRGASSAHLGAFTTDDIDQMDHEFIDSYFAGEFDRPCKECKGKNVVPGCKAADCSNPRSFIPGYFGNHEGVNCFDHDDEAAGAAEDAAVHAQEMRHCM